MNILFLTIAFPDLATDSNIYSDLMLELQSHGHSVYVMTCNERRYKKNTINERVKGINILRVKTGNLQKTNILEKGISTLLIERQYLTALRKYWGKIIFDLVIYSTPPITFSKVIKYIKNKCSAGSYLLLKDIFPQNAVDIGLIKRNSLLHKYFRHKEKKLYRYSDYIGCMSQANVDYIIRHNPEIDLSKVEVCPNSIYPSTYSVTESFISNIRSQYNIPRGAFVCIYGGNIGKPQGIDFLMDVLKLKQENKKVFFLIIGSGTEYSRLDSFIKAHKLTNVNLYPFMKKLDFTNLVLASDCGLIFLDKRFTIPNFPSRLLTYMDCSKPVLAATDISSDIGKVIEEGQFGLWCKNGDINALNYNLIQIINDRDLCNSMGLNANKYLIDNYSVKYAAKIIQDHYKV